LNNFLVGQYLLAQYLVGQYMSNDTVDTILAKQYFHDDPEPSLQHRRL